MNKFNWKAAWAWFCGIAGGPATIYAPYIAQFNFSHIPAETHGSALLSVLAGLGLVSMQRPGDHKETTESGDGSTK